MRMMEQLKRMSGCGFLAMILVAFACSSLPQARAGIDLERIEAELKGAGATGFIHGRAAYPSGARKKLRAARENSVEYTVLTFREPGDFFSHYEAPLVGQTPAIEAQLRGLGRHDKIRVRGEFVMHEAPVRHILVQAIEVLQKHDAGTGGMPPYAYEARIPTDLKDVPSFVGKVHAVADGGKVLVVEYKDAVLPLFPRGAELTRDLFRGDTIRVFHKIRTSPSAPPHLGFDPTVATPLVVLERLADRHGKPAQLSGVLAKFPKSPQILFDVYALITTNEHGVAHDFTLANLTNPEVFQALRAKLQAVWDAHAASAQLGRNQLINRKLRVTARGTFNVVAADQANPQILIDSPDQVSVEVLP